VALLVDLSVKAAKALERLSSGDPLAWREAIDVLGEVVDLAAAVPTTRRVAG
jgi:hypothetical protein